MDAVVTADTHLAASGRYLDVDGDELAAYRAGFRRAFEEVVTAAIDREADLFVHCGDLFDVADPGTAALTHAVARFRELERAGVTPVVVPGNHDYSRVVDGAEVSDPDSTTPVDLLGAADVGVVFPETERLAARRLDVDGTSVWVGGLGYDPKLAADADPLAGVEGGDEATTSECSLLVTHHCIEGHEWGLEAEFPVVTRETIRRLGVDAVCSGHVHAHADFRVGETAVVVPGAPCPRSFEETVTPGYYTLALDDGAGATFHTLDGYGVVERRVDAATLPAGEETATLLERIEAWAPRDGLLWLVVTGDTAGLDIPAVREAHGNARHVRVVVE
jgi:DNA repair exonuclease SbcCD nuclease subunit